MTARAPRRAAFRLTGDHALGVAGIGLAGASAAFGIGMTLHGPVSSFGSGKNFTVFAQLAPRAIDGTAPQRTRTARVVPEPRDLDMTATASIAPRPAAEGREPPVLPAVTLEAVGADSATVAIDGRTQVVRVGDVLPGAGEILAILPGARPALRASRGLIVPAAE